MEAIFAVFIESMKVLLKKLTSQELYAVMNLQESSRNVDRGLADSSNFVYAGNKSRQYNSISISGWETGSLSITYPAAGFAPIVAVVI